ncbi:putative RNA-directed DNA polymerase from transposon BS [Trichonephila clavipes]|nr:putative RNA-directed DNA polymerase from transposon BS [Trichonephila clavipes]
MRQGLPQAAVLSCLLFNIMIDDLQTTIQKVLGVSSLFFADDVILWATSSNIRPLEDALNSSLLNLETWANTNKMEVIDLKTVSQFYNLSTKQHLFHLEYKELPLKQVSLSKYLGINLDSKLHWGTHIAETSEKGLKRLNLLKRLTAIKWGATQDILTTVYKTYVRPVLDYGCEVVTLASTTNLGKYDVVQTSALRIITGKAKSTPITAMQLQTGIKPLNSRRDKFTLKF